MPSFTTINGTDAETWRLNMAAVRSLGFFKFEILTIDRLIYIHCLKKGYHPTTNDNFNNSRRIPLIFGTNITE